MAVENFEQILQSINNSEIRVALEKLFALAGISTGSDGTSLSQNVIGDVTGNVTGNVTGDVTGDVIGDVSGVVSGVLNLAATQYIDGPVDLGNGDFPTSFIKLRGASTTLNITDWTFTEGGLYVLSCHDSTEDSNVTMSSGKTFDGTNNKATFDAENETLVLFGAESGEMVIVENLGAVTPSAV